MLITRLSQYLFIVEYPKEWYRLHTNVSLNNNIIMDSAMQVHKRNHRRQNLSNMRQPCFSSPSCDDSMIDIRLTPYRDGIEMVNLHHYSPSPLPTETSHLRALTSGNFLTVLCPLLPFPDPSHNLYLSIVFFKIIFLYLSYLFPGKPVAIAVSQLCQAW